MVSELFNTDLSVTRRQNFTVGEAGPEFVHVEGPHASSKSQRNSVTNKIPSSSGIRSGGGSGGGSGEPIVIQNHLHMDGREIASIVSNVTANIGNRRQRHFR